MVDFAPNGTCPVCGVPYESTSRLWVKCVHTAEIIKHEGIKVDLPQPIPHSPDAYALVEKVLRNREVLKRAQDALLYEVCLEESTEEFKHKWKEMLERERTRLQQLIDSL